MVYGLVPPPGVNVTLPVETHPVGCVTVLLRVNAGGAALIVTVLVAVQEAASVTVYVKIPAERFVVVVGFIV